MGVRKMLLKSRKQKAAEFISAADQFDQATMAPTQTQEVRPDYKNKSLSNFDLELNLR